MINVFIHLNVKKYFVILYLYFSVTRLLLHSIFLYSSVTECDVKCCFWMWCHVLFLYVMSRVVSGCNVTCFVLTDMQQCAFLYCWCLIFTVVGPTFSLYLPNMQKSRKNAIPSLQSNYKGNKVLYIWIKQKKNTLIILYVWRYRDLEGFFFYSSTHWTYYNTLV